MNDLITTDKSNILLMKLARNIEIQFQNSMICNVWWAITFGISSWAYMWGDRVSALCIH